MLEDYKPLDVECAAMGLELCRGIRARYPEWRHLADGDGGDENLKDYPIEENHELTIKSVINNLMLYQEGWGVGRIKHSLTYSGGLSRSYVRTYAPARRYGFAGFSPYTQPAVVEIAEGIPFAALTDYDVPTLYALKGEIVAPRRQGRHRLRHAGVPETPLPARRDAGRGDALRVWAGPNRPTARAFHGLYCVAPDVVLSGGRCRARSLRPGSASAAARSMIPGAPGVARRGRAQRRTEPSRAWPRCSSPAASARGAA